MEKILIVCKGNICRSPLAHAMLSQKATAHGLLDVYVDSAGTGPWHIGKLPDPRTIEVAKRNNLDITHLRSRQFQLSDFDQFDLILTMDQDNYDRVMEQSKTSEHRSKVFSITKFAGVNQKSVEDPYHQGERDFDLIYEQLDHLTDRIIQHLKIFV